jgi:valyl-tRNA synthetase
VPPSAIAPLVVVGANGVTRERLLRHEAAIKRLARVGEISLADQAPKGSAQVIVGEATACLPLGSLIDVAAERARIEKAIGKTDVDIDKTQKKLGNEKFVANADPEIVATERQRLAELEAQRAVLAIALQRINEAV